MAQHIKYLRAFPSSAGGADFKEWSVKIIRFVRHGCANRPFFHISVMERNHDPYSPVIEQVGSYDPMPNMYNEKLVALNFDRIYYWLKNGAELSLPVKKLLGLAGFFPVHPTTYEQAWLRRKQILETLKQLKDIEKERENDNLKNETSGQ